MRRPALPPRPTWLLLAALTASAWATPPVGIALLPIEVRSDDRAVAMEVRRQLPGSLRSVFQESGCYQWVERYDPVIRSRILEELALQNSGLVADEEVRRLGRLAGIGVFAAVSGDVSVSLTGTRLSLDIRLIDVETSRLLAVHRIQVRGRFHLDPDRSAAHAVDQAMHTLARRLHRSGSQPEEP